MHRILNIAVNENNDDDFIEQPIADYIFITSVRADINLLSELLKDNKYNALKNNIRAIHLSFLNQPSQIDNYFNKTLEYAKIIVLRLFGDKGKWIYGLEKLQKWKEKGGRELLVLSGTEDEDLSLSELGTINPCDSIKISKLLREGGKENYQKFLVYLNLLSTNNKGIPANLLNSISYPDPYKYDWQEEIGPNVAVISYKSLFLANEIEMTENLNIHLRRNGLSPKTVFISTLKDISIQKKLVNLFKEIDISLIITTTSFNSLLDNKLNEFSQDFNLFGFLKVPILQILTSSRSKEEWTNSTIGMNSIDLLMQIIIPEFDGRIITRPCSFKEVKELNESLCSEISSFKSCSKGLEWVSKLTSNYIKLSKLENNQKRVCLVVSNYPIKNSRLCNGVGLNTPDSILNILNWLKEEGDDNGEQEIPSSSKELMSLLIKTRTNDPESIANEPMDFLPLNDYLTYWNQLPTKSSEIIQSRWDLPLKSIDLDSEGFSIHGLRFGKVCILIQPSRGYQPDSDKDLHSPDLPPPHRYLAQYHWVDKFFKANVICHVGKHGNLEWLPGKSVGLSENCFPNICPPVPVIYPFIVNDPGEGSQAKRRTHSTIIDHLTPPLDRSELYGDLSKLENLIDEYYDAKLLNSSRLIILEDSIRNIVKTEFKDIFDSKKIDLIDELDSYLCDIKESQIRVGLHVFGSGHETIDEINLIICIARVPTASRLGITQFLKENLNLDLEPWTNNTKQILSENDIKILSSLSKEKILSFRHAVDFLEEQSKYLIYYKFYKSNIYIKEIELLKSDKLFKRIKNFLNDNYFEAIKEEVFIPIKKSSINEKNSFIDALNSKYIYSGPSGSPTRGKLEVLPTGKNFYSVDTRGLPTESAWEVGNQSGLQILNLYKQENGDDLRHMAISLWATSTMRNGGEDICQILYLMGIKPVWDGPTRRVVDLEVIPPSILLRPRVDVTVRISGMFRDSFPQLVRIISKSINLIANLNEPPEDNPLANSVRDNNTINRIFGSAPGSYGAGLQELISYSNWNNLEDLSEAYLSWSNWSYDNNFEGKYSRAELESVLKDIQVVIHNQDNKEHDILDSDDYYQFQGGLTAAIKMISGKFPEIYHGDLSKFRNSKISKLSFEIDKVVRSRVVNPKWKEGMKKNGYKGAFEFSATLDYLYGYDATTNLVTDKTYSSIYNSWLKDSDLLNFFKEHNAWALRDIAQRFLEIINRKMWINPEKEIIDDLKFIINQTESKIEKNDF